MTDKEIIEALNCHSDKKIVKCRDCGYADYFGQCVGLVCEDALDLIQRQQAEIERLKEEHDKNFEKWEILDKRTKERYAELYEEAKGVVRAEAIKEFADRLKKEAMTKFDWNDYVDVEEIDILVNEMVGTDNG